MAMIMAVFVAPMQLLIGDLHGLNTLAHQPVKVAAMEGLWETQRGAPLKLFGWPDQEAETTRLSLNIPKLSSLILTHDLDGEVRGLKDWPKDERPPVAVVFWAFRIMVGLGMLMILTGVLALILYLRKRLFDTRPFQLWCMALTPAGFIAVLSGWFVTEVGRQPYVVYGVLRTADAVSPLPGGPIAISLTAFIFTYAVVFGAGSYYILRLIGKGPPHELAVAIVLFRVTNMCMAMHGDLDGSIKRRLTKMGGSFRGKRSPTALSLTKRDDGKAGHDIVPCKTLNDRAFQEVIAGGRWIVKTKGDLDHCGCPNVGRRKASIIDDVS